MTLSVAFKGQSDKRVVSGIIFSGVGNGWRENKDKWIVCCKNSSLPFLDADDFICINTETLGMRGFKENEIRSYPWDDKIPDMELAKTWYQKFLDKLER